MELQDLGIYRLSRECRKDAWPIYGRLHWQEKKTMGDQWLSSMDSIGANIAEGFGRFHFLDKNKFNLNARGSLTETIHWTELMKERGKMTEGEYSALLSKLRQLYISLNKYIQTTRQMSRS